MTSLLVPTKFICVFKGPFEGSLLSSLSFSFRKSVFKTVLIGTTTMMLTGDFVGLLSESSWRVAIFSKITNSFACPVFWSAFNLLVCR